jgi:hypothetical protein
MSRTFLPSFEDVRDSLPMDYDGKLNPLRDLIRELDLDESEAVIEDYEKMYKKMLKTKKITDATAKVIYAFGLLFVLFNKKVFKIKKRLNVFIDLNKPDFLFSLLPLKVPRSDAKFEKDVLKASEEFFAVIGPKETHKVVAPKKKTIKRKATEDDKIDFVTKSIIKKKDPKDFPKIAYTKLTKISREDPTSRIKTDTRPSYVRYSGISMPLKEIKERPEYNKAVYDEVMEEFKKFMETKMPKQEVKIVKPNLKEITTKPASSFIKKNGVLYKYALKFRMDYIKKEGQLNDKIESMTKGMGGMRISKRRQSLEDIFANMSINEEPAEREILEKRLTTQQARMLKKLKKEE